MKSPVRVRRFFAYVVLACWVAMTLFAVGDFLVDQHARAMSVHEAVFHAKPQSENVPQLEAETEALKAVVDYQTYRATEAKWEFRIWVGLTLLGAALFAEREQR